MGWFSDTENWITFNVTNYIEDNIGSANYSADVSINPENPGVIHIDGDGRGYQGTELDIDEANFHKVIEAGAGYFAEDGEITELDAGILVAVHDKLGDIIKDPKEMGIEPGSDEYAALKETYRELDQHIPDDYTQYSKVHDLDGPDLTM